MTSDIGLESTRRFAAAETKRVLGIVEPTVDRLFAKARTVLGQDRANQCLELARLAELSRRWVPTSALASLVAGTQALGQEWWTQPHEELAPDRLWVATGIPDKLLSAGHGDRDPEDGGSCLAQLADWISDDAADKEWGRPVDHVDPDDPRVDGRVVLPAGVHAGDRVVAVTAPGGRVWVDVVEIGEGAGRSRLGSRLAERRYHDVAQARSAWAMVTGTGAIRLPGETPGRASDPFASPIEADDSRRLFKWAVAQGVAAKDLSGPWRTKDGLWSARLRLGLLYSRPGAWITFDDAVVAAVDGDRAALLDALAALDA